ncbi:nitroreductase family deazaflavin-dependent oxidoreductase, partial [Polymorphospora sp. 2-325]
MPALRNVTRRLGHRRWFAAAARVLVPADRLVSRLTRGRGV